MQLKSILFRLVLILAAFAIVPECWADDTAGGNIFVDARAGAIVGKPVSGGYDGGSQPSWGVDGGYRWKLDDQRALGFELGYAHFGKVAEYSGNFGRDQISASAMSLGANFQNLFGDDRAWIFQARGGLASVKIDDDFTFNFPNPSAGSDSSRETGLYLGLGIGRQLTQGFSVILAYSHYSANAGANQGGTDLNLNWIGLVAEYRFGD